MIGKPISNEIAFIKTNDIPVDSCSDNTLGTISIAEITQHTPLIVPGTLKPCLRKFLMLRMRNNVGAKHARMNLRIVTVTYSIIPIIFFLSPTGAYMESFPSYHPIGWTGLNLSLWSLFLFQKLSALRFGHI